MFTGFVNVQGVQNINVATANQVNAAQNLVINYNIIGVDLIHTFAQWCSNHKGNIQVLT
jgi:hypothetical protein